MENKGASPESDWFDLARIKQLVRLMRDNDLSEIDLSWNESRLRLRREIAAGVPMVSVAAPAAVPAPARMEPSSSAPAPSVKLNEIKSPIVGTFYAASGPDAEPFVKVGSKVQPESVCCIIEAMKVFNEIQAGVSGTIREILIENGAPVEYGQVLFRWD
jgi:acetyl-CoA carboxylase biotin carboxyl carrier protein